MISFPTLDWLAQLKAGYVTDHSIMSILDAFQAGKEGPKGFIMQNGLLLYKGRMYLGHFGFLKILHRVQRDFTGLG